MKLTDLDQSRSLFHLGAASLAGIPAGDASRFFEAFNNIQNDYMMNKVREQLDRCDRAFELSELAGDTTGRYQSKEGYFGDINRTIVRESSKDARIWWENYLKETDILAHLLWVPNYNREESLRYRFERSGGEYVMSLPGVADTVAVSRMEAARIFAGSFGFV